MTEPSNEDLDALSVLVPSDDVVWRSVVGEIVLLDTEDNLLMGLNGTGGRMWSLLDGQRQLGEIAELVAAEYEQEAASVLDDLVGFAGMLLGRGLLRAA